MHRHAQATPAQARHRRAAAIAEGPVQLQDADHGPNALQASPRAHAQQHRLAQLFGDGQPLQRKVLIADKERPAKEEDDAKLKLASADEYRRFYADESEMQQHLVREQPTPVGLIKNIALWYRLPDFTKTFFVFGEYHSGVKGSALQAASHFEKPILDEALKGWTSGSAVTEDKKEDKKEDVKSEAPESSSVSSRPRNQGLEENGAKLLIGVQFVRWYTTRQLQALMNPKPSSDRAAETLPKIPEGESSTRIRKDGTHRLVVRGKGGDEELWKPKEPEKETVYDTASESSDAVSSLFPEVFAAEIAQGKLDEHTAGLKEAWADFQDKVWSKQRPRSGIQALDRVTKIIETAVRKKVQERYAKDVEDNKDVGLSDPEKPKQEKDPKEQADLYRDEYMLLRIVKAHAENSHAFATLGDAHRTRLQSRLEKKGIATIAAEDFYGPKMSKTAVDTE